MLSPMKPFHDATFGTRILDTVGNIYSIYGVGKILSAIVNGMLYHAIGLFHVIVRLVFVDIVATALRING